MVGEEFELHAKNDQEDRGQYLEEELHRRGKGEEVIRQAHDGHDRPADQDGEDARRIRRRGQHQRGDDTQEKGEIDGEPAQIGDWGRVLFQLAQGGIHELGAYGDLAEEGGQPQGKGESGEKDDPVGVQGQFSGVRVQVSALGQRPLLTADN